MNVQIAQKKSHQNWSIGRPRCDFLGMLMNLGKLVFFMFFDAAKRRAKIMKTNNLGRAEIENCGPLIVLVGHLSSGSGQTGWFYILKFDNAWHRPASADFGAHWILKGSQKCIIFALRPRAVPEKTKKLMENNARRSSLRRKKKCSHYTCCNLRGLAGLEIWYKMKLQKASKINPNWQLWNHRVGF